MQRSMLQQFKMWSCILSNIIITWVVCQGRYTHRDLVPEEEWQEASFFMVSMHEDDGKLRPISICSAGVPYPLSSEDPAHLAIKTAYDLEMKRIALGVTRKVKDLHEKIAGMVTQIVF